MALTEIVAPKGVAQNTLEMARGNIGIIEDIEEINGQPMIQNVLEIPAQSGGGGNIFITVD